MTLVTGFDLIPTAITAQEFAQVADWLEFGGKTDLVADCALCTTSLKVRAQVTGPLASVQVCQTFHNPYPDVLEAIYVFPLSPRAALHQFRMQIGERVVEGEIQEKSLARETYEEGRRQGCRTWSLERLR